MASVNYQEFYKAALDAAGGPPSEVLPKGRYHLRIKALKPGTAKGNSGKFQLGIRLEVIDGEQAGKSTWVNQTLTVENPKAFGVFLKYMLALGVPQSALDQGVAPDKLHEYIVVGTEGYGDVDSHAFGSLPDGQPKLHQDLKGFQITTVPTVTTSGVVIPSGPVAAPAPVVTAPVPVAVSAPVAQVVAPAPAADDQIAALQEQLAALQARPAPVAAAPSGMKVPF